MWYIRCTNIAAEIMMGHRLLRAGSVRSVFDNNNSKDYPFKSILLIDVRVSGHRREISTICFTMITWRVDIPTTRGVLNSMPTMHIFPMHFLGMIPVGSNIRQRHVCVGTTLGSRADMSMYAYTANNRSWGRYNYLVSNPITWHE